MSVPVSHPFPWNGSQRRDPHPGSWYRMQWLGIGMAVFGVPLGVGIGMALHNMAFIGIGLPIGLVIGIAVGTAKDKQAANNFKKFISSSEGIQRIPSSVTELILKISNITKAKL